MAENGEFNYGDNVDSNAAKSASPSKDTMDYIMKRTGGHYQNTGS